MKKTTMAILTGFLFLSVAIISCKKDDVESTPAPTITSFTPTSGVVGVTVTITGTNLNGATAVSFGGTAAASFSVVSSTSITAVVGTGATGTVTVTTPGGTASLAGFTLNLPDIDGYSSSNAVAADRLLAHWSFDDNATEAISTLAPSIHGGVSFEDAKIGKGISLDAAYLIYPQIPNLQFQDTLKSFTVSTWLNISANNVALFPPDGQLSSIFQICGTNFQDIWGLIGLNVTQNYHWGGDTLGLAGTTVHVNGTGTHPEPMFALDPRGTPSEIFQGANHWSFVAMTYDGPGHLISFYGNGVLLGTRVTTNVPAGGETFQVLTPAQAAFGTFEFIDDFPDGIYGHPPLAADRPWASHGITAKIDDTRLFTKALDPTELLALTHLGDAGR